MPRRRRVRRRGPQYPTTVANANYCTDAASSTTDSAEETARSSPHSSPVRRRRLRLRQLVSSLPVRPRQAGRQVQGPLQWTAAHPALLVRRRRRRPHRRGRHRRHLGVTDGTWAAAEPLRRRLRQVGLREVLQRPLLHHLLLSGRHHRSHARQAPPAPRRHRQPGGAASRRAAGTLRAEEVQRRRPPRSRCNPDLPRHGQGPTHGRNVLHPLRGRRLRGPRQAQGGGHPASSTSATTSVDRAGSYRGRLRREVRAGRWRREVEVRVLHRPRAPGAARRCRRRSAGGREEVRRPSCSCTASTARARRHAPGPRHRARPAAPHGACYCHRPGLQCDENTSNSRRQVGVPHRGRLPDRRQEADRGRWRPRSPVLRRRRVAVDDRHRRRRVQPVGHRGVRGDRGEPQGLLRQAAHCERWPHAQRPSAAVPPGCHGSVAAWRYMCVCGPSTTS